MKKIRKLGLFCVALIGVISLTITCRALLGDSQHTSLHWSRSTPVPEPTSGYAVGIIQGNLILAGGTYWLGSAHHWTQKIFSATTYSYDPVAESWQKLADEPIPLGYAASAAIDDTLYVMGGHDGQRVSREVFTLAKVQSDYVWREFGRLPVDRVFAQAVAVDKKIYLLGGSKKFEPMDSIGTCCTTKTATNTLMVLDTVHPGVGWHELAPYAGATRWNFTATTDGHAIWMFGGQYRGDTKGPVQNFTEVLRYDLKTNQWKVAGHLPQDLSADPYVSVINLSANMILISGMKKVWQLNLQTLKYTDLAPLPAAAYVDKFVWLRNRLIGAGGENADSEGPRRRSDATFVGQF